MPTGRVSWFGGPQDSSDSGHTASGGTTATPGIALYNRSTLGGYWRVKFPNGRTLTLKQTDIGPAPWTGRKVDVTYSALKQAGYTTGNFPTDANVQYSYLGKNPPAGGAQPQQASQGGSGTTTTKTVTPGVDNSAQRKSLMFQYLSAPKADPFSTKNLTPSPVTDPVKAVSQLQSQGPDLSKTLAKAAAGSNSLLSLAGNLQQAQDVPAVTKTVVQRQQAQGGGGGSGYRHPIPGASISSHDNGADFETRPGTPLRAVGSGTIVNTQGAFPGGSIVLKLDHPYRGKQYVYYGHLNNNNKEVHVGQRVGAGQIIARTSNRPAGASDMPGHTEIGFATGAGGGIETGGAYQGNRSVGSSYGQLFSRFLSGLR